MEISHRIHFWHKKFAENYDFLRKLQKNDFLVKKKSDGLQNAIFKVKMLKLHENHLKTNV